MAVPKSADGPQPAFEFKPELPDLVERARRAIQSGWCDEFGVENLPTGLGVSDVALGEQFESCLGASPTQVHRSHVGHMAQTLLAHTDLSLDAITTGVGLGSRPELDDILDRPVTKARAAVDGTRPGVVIPLPYWPGVDIDTTLAYLASRAIPGTESVEDGAYIRKVTTESGGSATIRIAPAQRHMLELELEDRASFDGRGELLTLATKCRQLFALDEPLASSAVGVSTDPILGPLVDTNPGLRLAGTWDPFETAIRIVVGQQVTVAAASTLAGRIVDRFGTLDPATLAEADLTGMGMPGSRARTISNLAAAVVDDTVNLRSISTLARSVADLTAVVGIGPWTAQLIAARVLRHPDAFPPKDLGLMRAYERLGGNESVESAAARWQPRRAAAIAYLWFSDTIG